MMENPNNYTQIYTITTEGCESCALVDRLIEEALNITKKKPLYTKQDYKQVDKKWLKQNHVDDFPTTFLIKNDTIRYKFVGTRPAIVIARWIDVHL